MVCTGGRVTPGRPFRDRRLLPRAAGPRVRLATGTDVELATERRAIQDVEIEAPGVVYAFNTVKGTADVGNVALVPLSRVIAAVS